MGEWDGEADALDAATSAPHPFMPHEEHNAIDPLLADSVDEALVGDPLEDVPEAQPERILASPTDFASLYIRGRSAVESVAARFLSDRRDIDEVVQETFLRLFLAMPEVENELQALAFCRRVATNLCIDRYRSDRRRPQLFELDAAIDSMPPAIEPIDPIEQAEDAAVVRRALGMLSPIHRAALVKREIEEKPLPVIAAELGVPEESVKHLLFRARRSLRRLLVGSTVDPQADLTAAEIVSVANRRLAETTLNGANVFLALLAVVLFVAGGRGLVHVLPGAGSSIPTQSVGAHAAPGGHSGDVAGATGHSGRSSRANPSSGSKPVATVGGGATPSTATGSAAHSFALSVHDAASTGLSVQPGTAPAPSSSGGTSKPTTPPSSPTTPPSSPTTPPSSPTTPPSTPTTPPTSPTGNPGGTTSPNYALAGSINATGPVAIGNQIRVNMGTSSATSLSDLNAPIGDQDFQMQQALLSPGTSVAQMQLAPSVQDSSGGSLTLPIASTTTSVTLNPSNLTYDVRVFATLGVGSTSASPASLQVDITYDTSEQTILAETVLVQGLDVDAPVVPAQSSVASPSPSPSATSDIASDTPTPAPTPAG